VVLFHQGAAVDDKPKRLGRSPRERVIYVATLEAVVLGALAGFPRLGHYGPSVDGWLVSVRFGLLVVAGLLAASLAFYALAVEEMWWAAAPLGLVFLNLAVLVPVVYGLLYMDVESLRLDSLLWKIPTILIAIYVVRCVVIAVIIVIRLMMNGLKADRPSR
jgi:hypothetical protein